ncbi:sn-1,2-diacylglycerol ethanolamine-and cholinephosphotranferases [Phaffia rhodozyma]|uniref:diacylglycerol cholinephosphotransferase n=1 Tax=Phaffia rhodozyma TaxID=264483 RepID=A0A0F7SLA2_PHARH|nr:sn-1,2-diacylglycerol ethanolamine-and cholinephosphotranferases [Phaffia rhodozyma]
MRFIPSTHIDNLSKYKYSGIDKSITSRFILNPFWNRLVLLFPKWIAPNTITFSGLCIIFVNFATMLAFDPKFKVDQALPSWVYWSWGIGLFAYQSMDAIDGKQARRTGMAGPLGEMFDHGCDAMNTSLEVILAAHALNLGRSWWTVASQAASLSNFYLTTWEEYHTGTLYLSVFSGPVEGILMICVLYCITGVYGPTFWDQSIIQFFKLDSVVPALGENKRLMDLGLNDSFMIFGAISLAFNVWGSYSNVVVARRSKGQPINTPLRGLVPFMVQLSALLAWLAADYPTSTRILYSDNFLYFLGFVGFGFAYQVGTMILAHVTKMPFPMWNGWMVWTAIGALDANLPNLFGVSPVIQSTQTKSSGFILLSLFVALAIYLNFAFSVIWQITEYTGIACFTVRKKDQSGHWVKAAKAEEEKRVKSL